MSKNNPKAKTTMGEKAALSLAVFISILCSPVFFWIATALYNAFLAQHVPGHDYLLYPFFVSFLIAVIFIISILILITPQIAVLFAANKVLNK